MKAYIRSACAISPQDTFSGGLFTSGIRKTEGDWMPCMEPDYKELINPALTRRMSRIIKMGVAAGIKSLKDAGIENPDAIITGTGFGCMEDTGNFLNSILKNKELLLAPTAFIQSTHNTISAQIALMIKCNNYNFAYVHRGFSFESALLDAMMLISGGEAENVLLGGLDEITRDYWDITRRLGMWKRKPADNLLLLDDREPGTLAGEGAAFFVLQKKSEGALAAFNGVDMVYEPSANDITERIHAMLGEAGLKMQDVDALMLGYNGWPVQDQYYREIEKQMPGIPVLGFKHLCGEFMTAPAFGAWLAAEAIRQGHVPEGVMLRGKTPAKLQNILICNHYMRLDHTLMLLSAC